MQDSRSWEARVEFCWRRLGFQSLIRPASKLRSERFRFETAVSSKGSQKAVEYASTASTVGVT